MQISLTHQLYLPNYDAERERCKEFITTFRDEAMTEDSVHGKLKYMSALQRVANKETRLMEVALGDIREHFNAQRDSGFIERVLTNSVRYIELFSSVCDQDMPKPSINIEDTNLNAFDLLMQQRRRNHDEVMQNQVNQGLMRQEQANPIGGDHIPKELERSFQLVLVPGEMGKKAVVKMREIKAQQIGSLVTIRGIVTRASDVKPLMKVAVYACEACGYEVYQIINQQVFNPLVECPSEKCKSNNIKGNLVMHTRSCRFESFQDIKIQEPSDQVPIGHVPRLMKIHASAELTRKCAPGDIVTITGVYMPRPNFGFRLPGLFQDTFVEAFEISKDKLNFRESFLTEERMEEVMDLKGNCESDSMLFSRLASSICPEIFGMNEVKQALLLLMVSGNTKKMADGMKIRGNINVLLMGDPGVAKSQLLKHISSFAPRGIYTTGKGSSGVGLTASVNKDQVTGELVLEGGALVLADTGICCIDEFDKMDDRDRTNIHEVMEQQTVSIAKAGITTSLNARTSVLAAANPLYGRYNVDKDPTENINLPAALLSRFDLIFLLLDRADVELDKQLAFHVASVHKNLSAPKQNIELQIDPEVMRAFISHAQTFDPVIPTDLHNYIVAKYVEKRKFQREGDTESSYMYVTPRTLLAIIRLAQAMAKLSFRNEVRQSDVDEAIRLMDFSIRSLRKVKTAKNARERQAYAESDKRDRLTNVMAQVRSVMTNKQEITISQLQGKINKKGVYNLSKDDLMDVLRYYAKLSVLYIDNDEKVMFL